MAPLNTRSVRARPNRHSPHGHEALTPPPLGFPPRTDIITESWAAAQPRPRTKAPEDRWRRQYRAGLISTDFVVTVLALAAGWAAVITLTNRGFTAEALRHVGFLLLLLFAWNIGLAVYRTREERLLGIGVDEYKRIATATLRMFGGVALAMVLLQRDISSTVLAVSLPLGLGGLFLGRWCWRKWLNSQRRLGHYLSRVVVFGCSEDVAYVVKQVSAHASATYQVAGLVVPGGPGPELDGVLEAGLPLATDPEEITEQVRALGANAVIVAGPVPGGNRYIRELGWRLENTATELILASSLTNVAGPRIHWRPVEGLPLMHVELPQYSGGKHVLKRCLDIGLASVALVGLAPVFAALFLIVHFDSKGPVIFRQQRVGVRGRTFQMLKFRSMVVDAEQRLAGLKNRNQGAGVLFKLKHDPRVTRCGRWMRRFSLDELPQLWNVLRGDMSLVGPRPPLPSEVKGYQGSTHRRLLIKPGLTGLWQINGRSNLAWDESIRLDLFYVENWSLTGDLMIMWRTVRVMVQPEGAY
ncbi:sugar transferase [Arthrobacter luteolus]|uniref:sugar transferase n=1 Tax=Arthrobacter luteolus TaxID=98672 RepID=UPI00083587DC|nr:sugar transferase [Arthrobacter luteolus]